MTGIVDGPTAHEGTSSSWKSRAWPGLPGLASPWIGIRGARVSSARVVVRRACAWEILVLRVAVCVLLVIVRRDVLGTTTSLAVGAAVGAVLLVLDVSSVVWCLAMVYRAEGYRVVFCVRVVSRVGFVSQLSPRETRSRGSRLTKGPPRRQGRNHLDCFLGICALLHMVLVVMVISYLIPVGLGIFWFALWVLIVAYGLLCTARPDSVA